MRINPRKPDLKQGFEGTNGWQMNIPLSMIPILGKLLSWTNHQRNELIRTIPRSQNSLLMNWTETQCRSTSIHTLGTNPHRYGVAIPVTYPDSQTDRVALHSGKPSLQMQLAIGLILYTITCCLDLSVLSVTINKLKCKSLKYCKLLKYCLRCT